MLKVLAVEDDEKLRNIVERALVSAGYQAFMAQSGSEALALAHKMAFDIVIVDYDIPAPNGVEVLAAVRELHPGCVSLLASGSLDLPIVTGAINRGDVSRVLEKPYTGRSLLAAVSEANSARRKIAERYIAATQEQEQAQFHALTECFEQNLFRLALQPIVSAHGRKVVAYEALLRSLHSELRGPLEVLQAAELNEQVARLGQRVAELSAALLDDIPRQTRLFLNLHPWQLSDPELLLESLMPVRKAANRVVLEITERSRVQDAQAWDQSLQRLAECGFVIAIDDLGAGYSSLSALARIKPRIMKVDMSIVRGVNLDVHKRRLLDLLCQFASATDAEVVAEGIETEAECATVVETGVTLLQGYLFGRPEIREGSSLRT